MQGGGHWFVRLGYVYSCIPSKCVYMILKIKCTWLRFSNLLKVSVNMPKDNTRYYYAVGKGRQTGVFDTW